MRHVALDALIAKTLADAEGQKCKKALERATTTLAKKPAQDRPAYFSASGASKWSPVKDKFVAVVGKKCWYTETEPVGADLTIDHYRPKALYWWLAFDSTNFRVACSFANSAHTNAETGTVGGKGDAFPLLDEGNRANCPEDDLFHELPIILDPCNEADCDLLQFQADGRPVLTPERQEDPIARKRVEESKSILNIDHPEFNSRREQLYHDIRLDVHLHDELPRGSEHQVELRRRLASRLAPTAPFSSAARTFLRFFRDREWVEEMLRETCL